MAHSYLRTPRIGDTLSCEEMRSIRKAQEVYLVGLLDKGERLTLEKYVEILHSRSYAMSIRRWREFKELIPKIVYDEIMSKPSHLQSSYFKQNLNPFDVANSVKRIQKEFDDDKKFWSNPENVRKYQTSELVLRIFGDT